MRKSKLTKRYLGTRIGTIWWLLLNRKTGGGDTPIPPTPTVKRHAVNTFAINTSI